MELRGGVETLTVTGAEPGAHLRVEDAHGRPLVTLVVDEVGNAHLAFVPPTHTVLSSEADLVDAVASGDPVTPGEYTVVDESVSPEERHGPVRVLGVDDHPDPSFYEQELQPGFGYLTVRDGVTLSIMVRFPDESVFGPAPWPTVIEYSGYGPSNPDALEPGTLLAGVLGFATVAVNIRGTGCSGGVFDVFSPGQAADGYDIVEIVARQPWVLHGRPGMVGLSYPGITQLYVAATNPPHLAAITPLSVIDDLWRQQWPGGIYNSGFTRAWVAMRDAQTRSGGMAWDQKIIDAGDEQARANQQIRSQNLDFESFGRAIADYRPALAARRIGELVGKIDVPVYLTGAWQDEQTGSRFASMIDAFTGSPDSRAIVFNGHHPDGYSPMVIQRWYEFLSFHVAKRVPKLPDLIREFGPMLFEEHFGYQPVLEPDRFAHHGDDLAAAMVEWQSEPRVRMLFESGAGHEVFGATAHRYEATSETFPPAGVVAQRWYLDADGALVDEPPAAEGTERYLDDPDAGDEGYAIELLDDLLRFTQPTVPTHWTRFDEAHRVAAETAPLAEPVAAVGAGHVDVWLRPGTDDTAVQATLTEIRSDGIEQRVQCGWHRPIHRVEDAAHSDELAVDYTFTPADRQPLEVGEWIRFRLPIYPFAHVFRKGSRIRLALSTPGRDHPFWCFDNPVVPGAEQVIGRGGEHATALVLPVWPAGIDHPEDLPPAGALRGQPARPAEPIHAPGSAQATEPVPTAVD